MDLLSRVFFFSGFTLLRAFLSAQKSAQGPAQPLCIIIIIITVAMFSGYISCTELRRVLTQRGQMPLSLQEVKAMCGALAWAMMMMIKLMMMMMIMQVEELIEAVDVDHDNQLNYSEFVHLFTQQLVL